MQFLRLRSKEEEAGKERVLLPALAIADDAQSREPLTNKEEAFAPVGRQRHRDERIGVWEGIGGLQQPAASSRRPPS